MIFLSIVATKVITTTQNKRQNADKKARIIQAAFKEFSEYGYEQASTNRIMKMADVSKGVIYYYFDSKETLFKYLIEYGMKHLLAVFTESLDTNTTDLIERYKKGMRAQLTAYIEEPYINRFFERVYAQDPALFLDELQKWNDGEYWGEHWSVGVLANIDTSLFRKDLPPERVIEIFQRAADGYGNKLLAEFRQVSLLEIDIEAYLQSCERFLDDLKIILYEQEKEQR